MKLRTVIVDDEKLARGKIRRSLSSEDDIEIVGEVTCGVDAVEIINEESPDLLFLDIHIPKPNGFEVLQKIKPDRMPVVIFVTAYDEYALKAFEVNALDYLLKPFDNERLKATLDRVRSQISTSRNGNVDERLLSLLSDLKAEKEYPERFVLKTAGRVYFVKTTEIDWVEAAGNYVKLHVGSDSHMLRDTMTNIEKKLPPEKFLRIHRSRVVNIDRIKELNPLFSGDYLVKLDDDTELTLSRNYHDRLTELFEKFS